jgi:hypothetical protein
LRVLDKQVCASMCFQGRRNNQERACEQHEILRCMCLCNYIETCHERSSLVCNVLPSHCNTILDYEFSSKKKVKKKEQNLAK